MAYYESFDDGYNSLLNAPAIPDIVMVFIGDSGSGKSTCINYFANYFTNSKFDRHNHYDNMKIVIPNNLFPKPNWIASKQEHSESNVHDQTISQTQDCVEYDFSYNEKNIKIIDTPGFNDTNIHKDDQNIQKILKKLSQLPFITSIIITINGTNSRLLMSMRSTLTQLQGSLPDSIFNNLIFIFTNCSEITRNFDIELLNDFNPPEERIFHMQNSLFSIRDRNILHSGKLAKKMESIWNESVETMGEIMEIIYTICAASAREFEDMRIRRERIIVHKENLILKQKSLLCITKQLEIEEELLTNAKSHQKTNRNYMESKRIMVIDIERKPYYSTLCAEHKEIQVCHENCFLSYEENFNFGHFKNCAAADKNNRQNCRKCRCAMNQHLHSYEIPVSRYKTIEEIIHSKKAAYDQATFNIRTSNSKIMELDSLRNDLQDEIFGIKRDLINTIHELKRICSNFNFLEEMRSTIEKLRKAAKIATDTKTKEEFNTTADAIEQIATKLTKQVYGVRPGNFRYENNYDS